MMFQFINFLVGATWSQKHMSLSRQHMKAFWNNYKLSGFISLNVYVKSQYKSKSRYVWARWVSENDLMVIRKLFHVIEEKFLRFVGELVYEGWAQTVSTSEIFYLRKLMRWTWALKSFLFDFWSEAVLRKMDSNSRKMFLLLSHPYFLMRSHL